MGDSPHILLAIDSREDRLAVAAAAPYGAVVVEADNCERARQALRTNPDIAVIVSDLTLSDGNWWCLHCEAVHRSAAADLIVLLPRADFDAPNVRAHGATVLSRPLEPEQVARALRDALECHVASPSSRPHDLRPTPSPNAMRQSARA